MSDEEDDYLSDKFLLESSTSTTTATKSYAERRKEALRRSAIKNEQNKKKSRREQEQESRQEGLSKSLFEKAKEEESEGSQNKALAMMLKMGFKPGQSLGKTEEEAQSHSPPAASNSTTPEAATPAVDSKDLSDAPRPTKSAHIVAPLPLQEWTGKTGIGLGKRAASPSASERLAKMAKMAEVHTQETFRDRARREYEERRAEGRVAPAQRTCATLDEKAGREFNVLWLNPATPETFPEGFMEALDDPGLVQLLERQRPHDTIEGRLRARMQADALQPVAALEDEEDVSGPKANVSKTPYSEEDIKEAAQFLRLGAQDRLELVLDYLRRRYAYCFWCGTQYNDDEDLQQSCPGPKEEDHD